MKLTIEIPVDAIRDPQGYAPYRIDFRPPPAVTRLLASIVRPLLDAKAIPNIGQGHSHAAVWLLEQLAEAAAVAEGAECARAGVDRLSPETAGPAEAARARDYYDRQAKERQKRKPADSVPENLPEQKGDARDQAAKAAGVSGKTVDFATKVLKQGTPELVKAVDFATARGHCCT